MSSNSTLAFWTARSKFRLDSADLYTALHFVIVFVRDQELSRRFYMEQLGFPLMVDHTFESGTRWVEVAPPDGTAHLALVTAKPGSEEYEQIGGFRGIFFLTEDVDAKYAEWSERGVKFQAPPESPVWGGRTTRFEDIDGNQFGLAGFDEATREMEAQRRAALQKAEAERRGVQEIEIAQQVQARLFPQTLPVCPSLDYAGVCIQARQVGGDYYDFLDLGQKRLGLILGDISGNGIAAALLMANLQANIRSQCASAFNQPQQFLRSTNELFFENTAESSYATLFFADYDQQTRQLSYINCGHLPAFLLRNDGSLDRLESTATVLGLFKDWDCNLEARQLGSGDLLVIYTDGVTESPNAEDEEFGEERLIESVRRYLDLPAHGMLTAIVQEVKQFCAHGEQADDITLIVAKCR